MGLDSVINSDKKIIALVALALIGVGFLADFITTIVWFSRIHPVFTHSYSNGKKVYSAVTACWVLSLIGLIVFALLVVFALFVKNLFEKIAGSKMGSLACIAIIGCLALGVFISGVFASSYALKNEKYYGENFKCYGPKGYFYIDEYWVETHEDEMAKLYKLAEKCKYEYNEEYDDYEEICTKTDTLCAAVGAPTLVFGIILMIGVILFIVIAVPNLNDSDNGNSKSEDQNDA